MASSVGLPVSEVQEIPVLRKSGALVVNGLHLENLLYPRLPVVWWFVGCRRLSVSEASGPSPWSAGLKGVVGIDGVLNYRAIKKKPCALAQGFFFV